MKHNRNFMKKIFIVTFACALANVAQLHAHLPAAATAGAVAGKEQVEQEKINKTLAELEKIYTDYTLSLSQKKNLLSYIKESTGLYHLNATLLITKQKDAFQDLGNATKKIEDFAWDNYEKNGGKRDLIEKLSAIMNRFINVKMKVLSYPDCLQAIDLLNRFQEYIKHDISRVGEHKVIEEA